MERTGVGTPVYVTAFVSVWPKLVVPVGAEVLLFVGEALASTVTAFAEA